MPDSSNKGGRKPRVTDEDLLDEFRATTDPVLSTAEVADAVPIKRRGTLNRLRDLEDAGTLDSKQIGGRNTVWWLLEGQDVPRAEERPPATDELQSGDVKGDIETSLDEDLPDEHTDALEDVVDALEDLGEATTAALVEHPDVDLSRQQVFGHLESLRERGVLTREQDDEDGRRVVWFDDGLHRLGEHGDVDLEPVDLEDLDDDEVRQLARSSNYTWEFTNHSVDGAGSAGDPSLGAPDPTRALANGGDTPPDDAD